MPNPAGAGGAPPDGASDADLVGERDREGAGGQDACVQPARPLHGDPSRIVKEEEADESAQPFRRVVFRDDAFREVPRSIVPVKVGCGLCASAFSGCEVGLADKSPPSPLRRGTVRRAPPTCRRIVPDHDVVAGWNVQA